MNDDLLVFFSDLHAGSSVGLLRPSGHTTQDGNHYEANPIQRELWRWWSHCWEQINTLRGRKTRLILVANGDMLDGNHHHTYQLIEPNPGRQVDIAEYSINHALELCKFNAKKRGDLLYIVSGTETHVGESFRAEEELARRLPATPQRAPHGLHDSGRWTWDKLRLNVQGNYINATHHGGSVGGRAWTKTSGAGLKAKDIYWRAVNNQQPVPRLSVFAHLHQYVRASYHDRQGTAEVLGLSSFQARSNFINQRTSATIENLADMGLVAVRVQGGNLTILPMIYEYEPDKVIEL